jgi:outer membrane protein TolC
LAVRSKKIFMRLFSLQFAIFLCLPAVADVYAQANEMQRMPCANASLSRPIALRDVVLTAIGNQPQLLIAQQDIQKARANLLAAVTPFLPSAALSFQDQHFVPSTATAPVVVGSTIVGGTRETYTSYGSVSVNWNLFNGGKDIAGYRGAQANIRSSEAARDNQLNDTLKSVLNAYSDLFKAQLTIREQDLILSLLKTIHARALERFQNSAGTTIAIGQARNAVLEADRQTAQACRVIIDKSAMLAEAIGIRLAPRQVFQVSEPILSFAEQINDPLELDSILQSDPAVVAANEAITVAQSKLNQAKTAFGPTLALVARRDFLGQNPNSFSAANNALSSNSYYVGIVLQQPIFGFTTEYANVRSARADLEKARITYAQAVIQSETKLRSALGANTEAEMSATSAQASLKEAANLASLAESLYKAGRTDLDTVNRARIDLEKADWQAQELTSDLNLSRWLATQALYPKDFSGRLMNKLEVGRGGVIAAQQ